MMWIVLLVTGCAAAPVAKRPNIEASATQAKGAEATGPALAFVVCARGQPPNAESPLAQVPGLRWGGDGGRCDAHLRREGDGYAWKPASGQERTVADASEAARQLRAWMAQRLLAEAADGSEALELRVSRATYKILADKSAVVTALASAAELQAQPLKAGDPVGFEVRNRGDRALHFVILQINDEGEREVLYPLEQVGQTAEIAANTTLLVPTPFRLDGKPRFEVLPLADPVDVRAALRGDAGVSTRGAPRRSPFGRLMRHMDRKPAFVKGQSPKPAAR